MKRTALCLLVAVAPLSAAAEATEPADPGTPTALSLGVALRLNTSGPIDLAALAGSPDYGAGEDGSGASLGIAVTVGAVIDPIELMVEAAVCIGGLDLAGVEERYYASEPQPIGGTSTAWMNASARYLIDPVPDVEIAAGVGLGYLVMGASSPVGGAFYRGFTAGPEVELRYRVHGETGRGGGGWLGLGFDARVLLPVVARVGAGPDPLFELDGVGDTNWVAGTGLYYRYDWR